MSEQLFHKFPKIYAMGHRATKDIFNGIVEITEKIDGSQFGFMKDDTGKLRFRSRGRELHPEKPDKMFLKGVEAVRMVQDKLIPNHLYLGEYLRAPKHNVLKYERTPKNHVALFAVFHKGSPIGNYNDIQAHAKRLGIDAVPLLYHGMAKLNTLDDITAFLDELLERESYLGGTKIEGVVVKNYELKQFISGHPDPERPLTSAKYVSERFKEKMTNKSRTPKPDKRTVQKLIESYKAEARWDKAIQHLREDGKLVGEPKDIGPLIAEIKKDIVEECREEIMIALYELFINDLLRNAINGFPEFYKAKLMEETWGNNG